MAVRISFYADEHVANAVIRGLRQRGVDVLSAAEAGMIGAEDSKHLARASSEGRVVVTRDADFLRLHARGVRHTGIAFVSRPMRVGELIQALVLFHHVLTAEQMGDQVEYL